VYRGCDDTGRLVAIKRVKLGRLSSAVRRHLEAEVGIMSKLSHDCIVKLIDSFSERDNLFLILEYVEGRQLDVIASNPVTRDTVKNITRQLVSAMIHLEENSIVHRDIKPQNIIIKSDGCLKLLDFGFAREFCNGDMMATICGSPNYMAPELLNLQMYDDKADIWSLGVLIYQLCYQRLPYGRATSMSDLRQRMASLQPSYAMDEDPQLLKLLGRLLNGTPSERPSLSEIRDSVWVRCEGARDIVDLQSASEINSSTTAQSLLEKNDVDDCMRTVVIDDVHDDTTSPQRIIDDYFPHVPHSEPVQISSNVQKTRTVTVYGTSLEGLGRLIVNRFISYGASTSSTGLH
jgi:serine/threonine protein kinase